MHHHSKMPYIDNLLARSFLSCCLGIERCKCNIISYSKTHFVFSWLANIKYDNIKGATCRPSSQRIVTEKQQPVTGDTGPRWAVRWGELSPKPLLKEKFLNCRREVERGFLAAWPSNRMTFADLRFITSSLHPIPNSKDTIYWASDTISIYRL